MSALLPEKTLNDSLMLTDHVSWNLANQTQARRRLGYINTEKAKKMFF